MTKVHPNFAATAATTTHIHPSFKADEPVVLTVWNRSLLFNCNGFTVYDCKGNLVYRVDNYMCSSGSNGQIVLMDAAGDPLLTVRRKRLSLGDTWVVYDGESGDSLRFTAKKQLNILKSKCLAHVTCDGDQYEIEGSYTQRQCVIYNEERKKVAEIKQKETVAGVSFGGDVFRLVVSPEFDASVAMAVVIVLDQMFGSTKRFKTYKL